MGPSPRCRLVWPPWSSQTHLGGVAAVGADVGHSAKISPTMPRMKMVFKEAGWYRLTAHRSAGKGGSGSGIAQVAADEAIRIEVFVLRSQLGRPIVICVSCETRDMKDSAGWW
jgi:hypothetical protein